MAAPVVLLNGAPRSGKSSIAAALGEPWAGIGVDLWNRSVVPRSLLPGIGLRPGGERPDLEPLLPALYATLLASVLQHNRRGRPVVVDLGVHEDHGRPLALRALVARRLEGLPAYLVAVRCPLDEAVRRRRTGPGGYDTATEVVRRWERAVHTPAVADLELDTGARSPARCAEEVRRRLGDGRPPTALGTWARTSHQGPT